MCYLPTCTLDALPPKTAEEIMKEKKRLEEERKRSSITSDGSLLGDYAR